MFSPTPSTLSLETMLTASSHDRNSHPEHDHVKIATDVLTAFLRVDVDRDLSAEPPEPGEWYDAALRDDEVWKLNKALYGYRKAPKTVAPTCRQCLGKFELSPTPNRSELFQKR